jgi:TonB family protein
MKTEKFLVAAVLVFGFSCGFGMQTASPSPSPTASPTPSPSPSPSPSRSPSPSPSPLPSSSPVPSPSPSPSPSPKKIPQKIRVSQGVSDGLLIHRVEPVLAEPNMSAKGDVVLAMVINREGNVVRATVLNVPNGNPILAQSALEAVRQWKYKPFLLNGETLEVETTVTVHFNKQSRNPTQ